MNISPKQALQAIYNATRSLSIKADSHDQLRAMYEVVEASLSLLDEGEEKEHNGTNKKDKK